MAQPLDQTNQGLATRLDDWADAIENPGAHEMEMDIRAAAKRLRDVDDPTPLIPRLITELRKAATFSSDLETRTALRALLGDTL
jgi:hypothetical protein